MEKEGKPQAEVNESVDTEEQSLLTRRRALGLIGLAAFLAPTLLTISESEAGHGKKKKRSKKSRKSRKSKKSRKSHKSHKSRKSRKSRKSKKSRKHHKRKRKY